MSHLKVDGWLANDGGYPGSEPPMLIQIENANLQGKALIQVLIKAFSPHKWVDCNFQQVTDYEESTWHINIHYKRKAKGELDPYYTVSLLSEVSHCQHLQNCSLDQEFGRNAKLMEILLSWRGWDWRWETESWANRRVMESQWETNQRNQSSARTQESRGSMILVLIEDRPPCPLRVQRLHLGYHGLDSWMTRNIFAR